MFSQQIVNALSLGGVYALFALGFTLTFGVLNVVNLAHGALFMLGAYAALHATVALGMPLAGALLTAVAVSAAAGWMLDRLILAPLRARHAPHLAPMIATIGAAITLTSVIEGHFGAENLRFPPGTLGADSIALGGVRVTVLELQIMILALALMIGLFWALKKTLSGRALRAVAESPKAAALMGINVEKFCRGTR
jgi:branched-chain amino acid transport system permease protein